MMSRLLRPISSAVYINLPAASLHGHRSRIVADFCSYFRNPLCVNNEEHPGAFYCRLYPPFLPQTGSESQGSKFEIIFTFLPENPILLNCRCFREPIWETTGDATAVSVPTLFQKYGDTSIITERATAGPCNGNNIT